MNDTIMLVTIGADGSGLYAEYYAEGLESYVDFAEEMKDELECEYREQGWRGDMETTWSIHHTDYYKYNTGELISSGGF